MSVSDDRGDITQLIYRFYACMDEGRFDDLRSVFSEKVTAPTPDGSVVEGPDAVIAQASRAHSPEERSQHLVHNVLVEVDGDKADVRADVIAILSEGDAPEGRLAPEPGYTVSMRMRYEVVRAPHGWCVSSIKGDLVWLRDTQSQPVPAGG
nr:nuclear transport factor 2 family protein [uncultured bacterium]